MANNSAATDASQQPLSDPEHDRINLAQVFSHQNRILGRVVRSLRQGAPVSEDAESSIVPMVEVVDGAGADTLEQNSKGRASPVAGPFSIGEASRRRPPLVEHDDYPLGADATPSTEPGHGSRQRGSQTLVAAKAAARDVRLGALLKVGSTAATASTAQEWGEGLGGATGGFAGSVLGAALSKYAGRNAEYGKVVGGFFGEKVGAALGKRVAPHSEPGVLGEVAAPTTTAPSTEAETSQSSLGQGMLTGVSIGSIARAHQSGKQSSAMNWNRLKGWLGKGSPAANDPYPLGADAGPSPTEIGKRAPPWRTVGEVFKEEGKSVLLEAALKAGHTYATAKTAEEAWAGYGGAIGGLGGSVAGAVVLKRILPFVSPSVGTTLGGEVGDKAGTALGGWLARKLSKDEPHPPASTPLPAVSLLASPKPLVTPIPTNELFGLQLGTVTVKRLLLTPELARQKWVAKRSLPQVSLLDTPKHSLTPLPQTAFLEEQVGTRITRHLLAHPAAAQPRAVQPQRPAPVSLLRPASLEALNEAAGDRLFPLRAPPAAPALPDPDGPLPPQAKQSPPIAQHYTFNANLPVTINGCLDDPAVLQRLEAMVQRTLQELISRKAATQLSDPIYA